VTLTCLSLQSVPATAPFLAPLFDKMAAHDVRRRFTAEEALAFFEKHASSIPRTTKLEHLELLGSYEVRDYWVDVHSSLVEDWAHLREISPSPTTIFLRRMCERSHRAESVIRVLRRMFSSMAQVCRFLLLLS
jgi:uncharacterized protein (DUF2342 family)